VGVEALLRWHHPHHGQVPPGQFIPIAEASGLILALGEGVLQTACAQLRAWAGQLHTRGLMLSVNVSARQFAQPGFVEQVHAALASSGARPDLLVLELTESAMLHDIADAVRKMQTLRCLGVRFALDDFGTGYSCLSQLQRLPLYQLKIDRSFIQDMGPHARDAVIVQTIVGMARTLGLHVVAEGVETEAQRMVLAQLQCPAFQGYLFGMPQPAAALEAWLLGQHGTLSQAHPEPAVSPIFQR
jgi:EAL domain-containing protein (putative c-di-GMP-specific phosphodiesterase class I)